MVGVGGLGSTGPELGAARLLLGVSFQDLWIGYFEVGGNGSVADVERWLGSAAVVPDREHNLLAQALNDEFVERGGDHPVAYRERDTP